MPANPLHTTADADAGAAQATSVDSSVITAVFGDLLTATELTVDHPKALDELATLLTQPWADYRTNPTSRSALTTSGAPFELSLKMSARGQVAVRYVVDTADHRRSLHDNRQNYLQSAVLITGASDALLAALLDVHLLGAPEDLAPRVMHGVEHSAIRRRASLYFPSHWWTPSDLRNRVAASPHEIAPPEDHGDQLLAGVDPRIEVVGYDFRDQQVAAAKTYRWLHVSGADTIAEYARSDPSVGAPALLCWQFAAGIPTVARSRAAFLQLTGSGADARPKLFCFSQAWGWSTPQGLVALLGFLAETLRIDLSALLALRDSAAERQVALTLGLLAVGGTVDEATVTCYFWPT